MTYLLVEILEKNLYSWCSWCILMDLSWIFSEEFVFRKVETYCSILCLVDNACYTSWSSWILVRSFVVHEIRSNLVSEGHFSLTTHGKASFCYVPAGKLLFIGELRSFWMHCCRTYPLMIIQTNTACCNELLKLYSAALRSVQDIRYPTVWGNWSFTVLLLCRTTGKGCLWDQRGGSVTLSASPR